MRKAYQTDLSDAEWSCLEPHLPTPKASGRPRIYVLREILDAVFYVLKSGCAWRLLPHDLERLRRASTTTCAPGLWRAPGRGCMPPSCASVCESASTEILSPARP
jgi:transposase